MGHLREFLRENAKELYDSLERSWDIAFDTWLPAVGPNLDTYNSYPHLRNLELYADKVALAYKKYHHTENELLAPTETYVLLASILFHDIGKALGFGDHGEESERIIKSNRGILGIPNDEFGLTIARICRFHDYNAVDAEEHIETFSTVFIDPQGKIREREIAAILMLVDHMDGSFIRIVPDFISNDSEKKILGAFRKKIKGVDIDLDGGMVKVVLGEEGWEDKKTSGFVFKLNEEQKDKKQCLNRIRNDLDVLFKSNRLWLEMNVGKLNYHYSEVDNELLKKMFAAKSLMRHFAETSLMKQYSENIKMLNYTLIILHLIRVDKDELPKKSNDHATFTKKIIAEIAILLRGRLIHWNRIRNFKTVVIQDIERAILQQYKSQKPKEKTAFQLKYESKTKKGNPHSNPLPVEFLMATVLANTLENIEALLPIKDTLATVGLPVRGWQLEFKDHLYNYFGNETFEPIFTKEYLKKTVECMWNLSTRVFAPGTFRYETLAAEMREPNIVKVKRAVRRVTVISQGIQKGSGAGFHQNPSAIWFSDTHWKWVIKEESSGMDKEKYSCHDNVIMSFKKLIDSIKNTRTGDTNE